MNKKTKFWEHFVAQEEVMLARAKLAGNVGHTVIKGDSREAIVKQFLRSHVGPSIGIGSGEIFDMSTPSGSNQNQQDIILYDTQFPKFNLGEDGGDSFLIESVVATVEVKSTLTEDEYRKSALAASRTKALFSLDRKADIPVRPRCYLVAFAGPAKMSTVFGWMEKLYSDCATAQKHDEPHGEYWFEGKDELPRSRITSSSFDGIFILGKGFIVFDGFRFGSTEKYVDPNRLGGHKVKWKIADCEAGSTHTLFLAIMDGILPYNLLVHYAGTMPINSPNVQEMRTYSGKT